MPVRISGSRPGVSLIQRPFWSGDAVGVFENALNGTVAGLDDRAEALFLDAGQTACDVAGGRLTAAHVLADGLRAVFHPLDDLVNFLGDGAIGTANRTVGQNMLAAEEFGRFAEDDGRAKVDQLVGHVADDTVGGHAGGRIRSRRT